MAIELLEACTASPKALGLLQNLVCGIFEEGRAAPAHRYRTHRTCADYKDPDRRGEEP